MSDRTPSFQDKNSEEALLNRYVNEVSVYPPLSLEEEQRMATLIQNGDLQAMERLIDANLMFVVSIARQYKRHGVNMLDLINEGNIAMIHVARKYKPSGGKRFVQEAVYAIRKAIEAALPKEEIRINRTLTESLTGKGKEADSSAEEHTDKEAMAEAILLLPKREQTVLKALYGIDEYPQTMAEFAGAHDMTRERVRQIRNRAIRRLHSYRNKNFK